MILRKKWKKMLVISEIKTEFQGAQGKIDSNVVLQRALKKCWETINSMRIK